METIRSLQNPQVKEWAALQTKKGRDRSGSFLVEGAHLVLEALRSEFEVESVLYVPGSSAAQEIEHEKERGGRWVAVSDQVMEKITDAQTPQGVAAIVKQRVVPADRHFFTNVTAAVVAVDALQDPGNLGTVIRSSDAAGAQAVLLGSGTVDVYNPKTIRATMGSLFHLPVISCDLHATLPVMQSAGIRLIGTALSAKQSCYEASLGGRVCFLLGNEGAGVSSELLSLSDETVIIPMTGASESLNVAMAATVLLFEAQRQRMVPTQINSSHSY